MANAQLALCRNQNLTAKASQGRSAANHEVFVQAHPHEERRNELGMLAGILLTRNGEEVGEYRNLVEWSREPWE